MDYVESEYQKFLRYVQSTWGSLLDSDWKDEPKIKKVVLCLRGRNVQVATYLEDNVYYDYDFEKRELLEKEYTGKAIKTGYSLDEDILLYMITQCNVIEDLGLKDVKVILFDFVEGLEEDKKLSKRLTKIEEEYAYDLYCSEHDL